ncbi:hypothetical protein K504DRAFT_458997 [Pleomassaria siparia CBS 279.74]|uniref:F-box domain-containing protein n=1 Tax=Pleomassaria siparia CBS 279.74 TaxID=1314801 RepID=A0A6G1K263_9PLEO|nr:hypothetical protein K504DRAFT_458997 [Pleomassaria siparia CBS 279.74]
MATLDTLPTEILFNILSYASPFDPTLVPRHPLYTLAATNRHLRNVVEEYTRVLLKQYANYTIPKKSKIFASRKKWLKYIDGTCRLCEKKTVRKAILDPTMACCDKCDRAHFPKMSMTAAIKTHGLTKLDLFTPNALHPTLPPLSIGEYVCSGTDTTMISEPDLLARKALIHGMLRDSTPKALNRREKSHVLLLKHMNPTIPAGSSRWVRYRGDVNMSGSAWKTMRTPESRAEFVRKALQKERALLEENGNSSNTAIEVD